MVSGGREGGVGTASKVALDPVVIERTHDASGSQLAVT
jgi:hypothetical protein